MTIMQVEGAEQTWRVRFPLKDGRMCTHFVPVDKEMRIMATPALKVHNPDWIGMNFVTLNGKLFLEHRTKLTCRRMDKDNGPQHGVGQHQRMAQPEAYS